MKFFMFLETGKSATFKMSPFQHSAKFVVVFCTMLKKCRYSISCSKLILKETPRPQSLSTAKSRSK